MTDYVGQQLGNYSLKSKLGDGGFADVYLGEHIELNSRAAIKVLKKVLTGNEVDKFRKEARTLVNLRHPNIIRVLDFAVPQPLGTLPPFLVMEYAPGGTLADLQGKISPLSQIMPSIKQIANALQYVHDQGLVHLDIKPANILLGSCGEALLSDFGIAVAIQGIGLPAHKELLGTVEYMAPERLRRNPCPASDQYSLAVVVYELLTGACPFDGTTIEIVQQHFNQLPPLLRTKVASILSEIERVIDQALAKDPTKRFPTIQVFADELERAFLAGTRPSGSPQGVGSGPSSAPPTTPVGASSVYSAGQAAGGATGKTQRIGRSMGGLKQAYLTDATIYQLRGHSREVHSLAWSPDGKWLASASGDRTVRIWDIALGDVARIYQGHRKAVQMVAWAPNGAYLASMGGDQIVRVWDAATGDTLLAYVGHATQGIGFTFALAWSPDSCFLASGSDSNEVHVWEATTGQAVSSYSEHMSWISALSWSPDGQRIASGSNDRTVQVWEALIGKPILSYDHLAGEVCAVAWSPDGGHLAAAYRGTIKLWHGRRNDDVLATYEHRGVNSLSWSPDNHFLVSAGDDKLGEIREVQTSRVVFTYREHTVPVQAVVWSPDGKCLASADEDGLIYVWKPK